MESIKLFCIEGACSESLSIHYHRQPPAAQLFSHGIKSNCSPEIASFPSSVQRSCLSVLTGSLTTGGACSPSVFFPRPSASCPVWGYRMASGVMVSLTTAALLVLQSSCDSRCPSKLADIWESMVAFISWNIWLDLRVRMDQGPWMLLQSLWQNKNIKSSSHFIIHMYYFTFIQIAILFLRRSWEDLAAT